MPVNNIREIKMTNGMFPLNQVLTIVHMASRPNFLSAGSFVSADIFSLLTDRQ